MEPGLLRHRVRFERRDTTPDDYGNVTSGAWVTLATVWGGLRVERGRERVEAGRIESAVAGVLTVRSSATTRDVTTADRVVIDGDDYAIRSITNPDQRNAMLEILVERGVAQ